MEGKITRIVADRGFFFIDNDYWCGLRSYDRDPVEGDVVNYERETLPDGKKRANRVRFIKSAPNPLTDYLQIIARGYFYEQNYLHEDLIIKYPMLLAELFAQKGNKVNQVYNFYEQVINISGVYKINKDFRRVRVELQKLISSASKSYDRGNITVEFKDFISENINQAIKSEDAFVYGFVEHFQCLVNYYPSKI